MLWYMCISPFHYYKKQYYISDAQTALICHLNDVGLRTPKVLKRIDNRMKSLETLRGKAKYMFASQLSTKEMLMDR